MKVESKRWSPSAALFVSIRDSEKIVFPFALVNSINNKSIHVCNSFCAIRNEELQMIKVTKVTRISVNIEILLINFIYS